MDEAKNADMLVGLVFLANSKRIKLIHKDVILTVENNLPDHEVYPGDWVVVKSTDKRLTLIGRIEAPLPTRIFTGDPYARWHVIQVQTVAVRPKIYREAQYKNCVWSPHFGYILDPLGLFSNARLVHWDVAYAVWCTLNNEPGEPGLFRPLMAVVEIECYAADQMFALFAPWILEGNSVSESAEASHQVQEEADCQSDFPEPETSTSSALQSVSSFESSGTATNSEFVCMELLTAFSFLYSLLKERSCLMGRHLSDANKMDKKLAGKECDAETVAELSLRQQALEEEQRCSLREKFVCSLEQLISGCNAVGNGLPNQSRQDIRVLLDSQLRPQARAHYRWHLSVCGNEEKKKFIEKSLSKDDNYFDENISAWHSAVQILNTNVNVTSSAEVIKLMRHLVNYERGYNTHTENELNATRGSAQQEEKNRGTKVVPSETGTKCATSKETQQSKASETSEKKCLSKESTVSSEVETKRSPDKEAQPLITSQIPERKPLSDASSSSLSKVIIQLLTARRRLFLKHREESNKAVKKNNKTAIENLSKSQRSAEVQQYKMQSEVLEGLKLKGVLVNSANIESEVKKEAKKILDVIEPCARAQLEFHLRYYICGEDEKLSTTTFRTEISNILKLPSEKFLASEVISPVGLVIILPKKMASEKETRLQESVCCDRQKNDKKVDDKKTVDFSDKKMQPAKPQTSPADFLKRQLEERRGLFQLHRQKANQVLLLRNEKAAVELSSKLRALERKQWKEQSAALSLKFSSLQDSKKLPRGDAAEVLALVKEVCDLARAQDRFHRLYLPQGEGENASGAVERELTSSNLLFTKLVVTSDIGLKILRSVCGLQDDNDLEQVCSGRAEKDRKMNDQKVADSSDKAEEQTKPGIPLVDFLQKQLAGRKCLFTSHRQEANEVLRKKDENAAKALSLKQRALERKQWFVQLTALSAHSGSLKDIQKLPPVAAVKMLNLLKQVFDVAKAQNRFHKLYLSEGNDAVEKELSSDILMLRLVVTSEFGVQILRKACDIQDNKDLEEVIRYGETVCLGPAMKDFDEFFECWNLPSGSAAWVVSDCRDEGVIMSGNERHLMPTDYCKYPGMRDMAMHLKCVNAVERIDALSSARRSLCLGASDGLLQRRFQFLLCARRRSRLNIWTTKTSPSAKEAVTIIKDIFETDPSAFNLTLVFPKLYFDLFCTDYAFCEQRLNEMRPTVAPGSKRAMLIKALHEIINADKMEAASLTKMSNILPCVHAETAVDAAEYQSLRGIQYTEEEAKRCEERKDQYCLELLHSEKNKGETNDGCPSASSLSERDAKNGRCNIQ